MAEQISKKHRHQVIMSSNVTDLGAMTTVPNHCLATIICSIVLCRATILFCFAVAAHFSFEGLMTFDPY